MSKNINRTQKEFLELVEDREKFALEFYNWTEELLLRKHKDCDLWFRMTDNQNVWPENFRHPSTDEVMSKFIENYE